MKIDIWSDVRCPFCYIGKRKLEKALAQFEHKDSVVIEWHSFELDPNAETLIGVDAYDYLAERYDRDREWSIETHDRVAESAAQVGLTFNFDKAIMANSFDAHRLIQMAKGIGAAGEAEELLFKAHFTDGLNIADHAVLIEIGKQCGLGGLEVEMMLKSKDYTEEVRHDEDIAQQIRVKGVPFFVLEGKLGISGAQEPEVFLDAMNKIERGESFQ